jgi:hypothetical protein
VFGGPRAQLVKQIILRADQTVVIYSHENDGAVLYKSRSCVNIVLKNAIRMVIVVSTVSVGQKIDALRGK